MKRIILDGRLSSAVKFTRRGAVFADIGTDHGYLPLYLLENGIIERAILTDINRGPLSSATENARLYGLEDRCEFILSDGAAGLLGKGATDIAVCGMGGELIADIISKAEFLKDGGVRLILQPMSRVEKLRRYLWNSGFDIIAEEYSHSAGKYYLTMCVSYCGVCREGTLAEEFFGEQRFILPLTEEKRFYLNARRAALIKSCEGKKMGGEDAELERELLLYLDSILK